MPATSSRCVTRKTLTLPSSVNMRLLYARAITQHSSRLVNRRCPNSGVRAEMSTTKITPSLTSYQLPAAATACSGSHNRRPRSAGPAGRGKRISRPPIPEAKRRRIEKLHRAGTSIVDQRHPQKARHRLRYRLELCPALEQASREESAMPIRKELRYFYPIEAPLLLPDPLAAAFGLGALRPRQGCCEACDRPHGKIVHHLTAAGSTRRTRPGGTAGAGR